MFHAALAGQILLVVVFVAAVAGKVRTYEGFQASLRALGLLPWRSVPAAAALVVVGELAAVLLLLLAPVLGGVLAAALLASFSYAIIRSVRRGNQTSCHCFGYRGEVLGWRHVGRNGFLIGVAVLVAGAGTIEGALAGAQMLVAASAGLVGGLVVVLMDDVGALFRPASAAR